MLGKVTIYGHEQEDAVVAKCVDIWFRGLNSGEDKWNASKCAEDIFQAYLDQKKPYPAAYMFRWLETLLNEEQLASVKQLRETSWGKLKTSIPAEEIDALRGRRKISAALN